MNHWKTHLLRLAGLFCLSSILTARPATADAAPAPVKLEAISFHAFAAGYNSPLTIRQNDAATVELPEWKQGETRPEESPVAYAVAPEIPSLLRYVDKVRIGAVLSGSQTNQALPNQAVWVCARSSQTGVLGAVKARQISLGATPATEFFELQGTALAAKGIGREDVEWIWQWSDNEAGPWTEFARSRHRVYSVLSAPKGPWHGTLQSEFSTGEAKASALASHPWTDVLDRSCLWARGEKTPQGAAAAITRHLYELGRTNPKRLQYDDNGGGWSFTNYGYDEGTDTLKTPAYKILSMLDALERSPGPAVSFNCHDCSLAVCTMAQALGVNLRRLNLDFEALPPEYRSGGQRNTPLSSLSVTIRPVRLLGHEAVAATAFSNHAVAYLPQQRTGARYEEYPEDGLVFDACLGFGDRPVPVTGMKLGSPREKGTYLNQLIDHSLYSVNYYLAPVLPVSSFQITRGVQVAER